MRAAVSVLSLATLALAALTPAPARACGGVFCDRPPPNQPPMAIDQSGENVLFVASQGQVEAHVQIQYTGEPERFAWVVPMPKVPKISAGSQQLFTNLLNNTVPTYQLQLSFAGNCPQSSNGSGDSVGCGSSSDASDEAFSASAPRAAGDANGGQAKGPEVLARASVGSYETVTLGGGNGSAADLLDWLEANNYLTPEKTQGLIADYLAQDYVFVAVKLSAGKGLSEIHPLVFTYEGNQPCVPLKLTAVAATENMAVRVFFLGQDRYAPTNYKHVVLNELKFDWSRVQGGSINPSAQPLQQPANYLEHITQAIDSPVANGRAFITEFAGATPTAAASGLVDSRWQSSAFENASREQAIDKLKSQGLLTCGQGKCTSPSPLLFPLLQEVIPVPSGVSADAFYSCLACYKQADTTVWNAKYFALELEERIVGPAKHAQQILTTLPYMTRLFTTISPNEMTEDPEFARTARADIQTSHTATQQRQCDGQNVVQINQREVALGRNAVWPALPAAMPAALRVEEYRSDGGMMVLVDNQEVIDRELTAFNQGRNWPPQPSFDFEDDSNCALAQQPVRGRTTMGAFFGLAALALLARRGRRAS